MSSISALFASLSDLLANAPANTQDIGNVQDAGANTSGNANNNNFTALLDSVFAPPATQGSGQSASRQNTNDQSQNPPTPPAAPVNAPTVFAAPPPPPPPPHNFPASQSSNAGASGSPGNTSTSNNASSSQNNAASNNQANAPQSSQQNASASASSSSSSQDNTPSSSLSGSVPMLQAIAASANGITPADIAQAGKDLRAALSDQLSNVSQILLAMIQALTGGAATPAQSTTSNTPSDATQTTAPVSLATLDPAMLALLAQLQQSPVANNNAGASTDANTSPVTQGVTLLTDINSLIQQLQQALLSNGQGQNLPTDPTQPLVTQLQPQVQAPVQAQLLSSQPQLQTAQILTLPI
jgi:hypothetical protein